MEGGSQSRPKGINAVKGLQKLTSGKKMHCSNCRHAGHKKPKCPLLEQVPVDPEQVPVDHDQVPVEVEQLPTEKIQMPEVNK